MKSFFKSLFLILTTIIGAFIAAGVFIERCKKAVAVNPQPKAEPQKRPCEEAICAVDQCMPF